jgi:NAD(P)-dependent dehydrogenase (short-subunit alcohol dehydrogenase family)
MKIFSDTTVAVTGAGSGIGRALALEAARRGARVAVADIQLQSAETVADEISAAGGQATAFQVDVADAASFQALADAVEAAFGQVNGLFNNAGVFSFGDLERTKPEDFAWMFNVNVFGTFNGVKSFLPLVRRAAAAGEVAFFVNTGSENSLGLPPLGAFTAYTATKHAILGLSDGMRRDLADTGITVSLICPGPVKTAIWNSARTRQDRFGGPREARASAAAVLDMGQDPAEVARLTFAGMEAGDFVIVTDPAIQAFADKRAAEVSKAFEQLAERLPLARG